MLGYDNLDRQVYARDSRGEDLSVELRSSYDLAGRRTELATAINDTADLLKPGFFQHGDQPVAVLLPGYSHRRKKRFCGHGSNAP